MNFSKRFIKATDDLCDIGHPVAAPYLRRSFSLDFAPEQAQILITGQGFYALFVNGREITKCEMAPYIANPDDILYYDRYDLLPYLRKGKNAIGILLGGGFRNAFGGFVWDFEKATCRGPLCTALTLTAEGEGKSFSMEADENFRTHPSPILHNDQRFGYIYDSREEIDGWSDAGFDDSDWEYAKNCLPPRGEARLCKADPIAVLRRIRPVKIEHFDELPYCYENLREGAKAIPETVRKDVYVYDFGVNSAGLTELHIHGKPGQVVTVRHGEWKQNGAFSVGTTMFFGERRTKPYLDYNQTDVFILKGGEERLIPRFKYDGFQYAYVEGLEPEQAAEDALTFVELSGGFAERGGFSSSDEALNRLYELTVRSDRSNFLWFPTDCPHREKNGWTGDAAMSAEHMLLHMAASRSMRTWLENIRAAQREDGALPGIVPTGGWGFAWGNGPAWDSVAFELPYEIYRYDGDLDVIRENIPMMMRYLTYIMSRRDERGLVAIGLGDWIDPFQSKNGGKITAPLELTDSLMVYDSANKAAKMMRAVGRKEEAAYAESVAKAFRDAVRSCLIDPETLTVAGNCQTSQAFALDVGIFTAREFRKAGRRLVEIIRRDGEINTCGMIGLRHIYRALDKIGENELAYKLITSKERSCYGAWLEAGATALFENFPYPDGRESYSHNHHFLGDIAAWMQLCVAGLRPEPVSKSFVLKPTFLSALTNAKAYFEGLSTGWEKQSDGTVILRATVPEGMTGSLILPKDYFSEEKLPDALTAGEYCFKLLKK